MRARRTAPASRSSRYSFGSLVRVCTARRTPRATFRPIGARGLALESAPVRERSAVPTERTYTLAEMRGILGIR